MHVAGHVRILHEQGGLLRMHYSVHHSGAAHEPILQALHYAHVPTQALKLGQRSSCGPSETRTQTAHRASKAKRHGQVGRPCSHEINCTQITMDRWNVH